MRRGRAGGFSLVELLASTAIFGSLTLAGATLLFQSQRAAGEAGRQARAREERWEAVRLLRRDVGRAKAARSVRGGGRSTGLELSQDDGLVWWTPVEGELSRSSDFGPPLRPLAVRAELEIERRSGREFVRYRFSDDQDSVEGSVLLGGTR